MVRRWAEPLDGLGSGEGCGEEGLMMESRQCQERRGAQEVAWLGHGPGPTPAECPMMIEA
eukprot:1918078-Ditylum_brightwellii.AAC.1